MTNRKMTFSEYAAMVEKDWSLMFMRPSAASCTVVETISNYGSVRIVQKPEGVVLFEACEWCGTKKGIFYGLDERPYCKSCGGPV